MSENSTFLIVRDVVAKMFVADPTEIDESTTAADINGWDSLSHTFLILAVEEKFAIQFDPYSVGDFSCIGDMVVEIERLSA